MNKEHKEEIVTYRPELADKDEMSERFFYVAKGLDMARHIYYGYKPVPDSFSKKLLEEAEKLRGGRHA